MFYLPNVPFGMHGQKAYLKDKDRNLNYPHESIRKDIMRREFTYMLPDSVSRKKVHRHINKYISRGFSLRGFALPTETIAVDYFRAGQPLHPTFAKLAWCFGIPPCTYCGQYRPNESRIDICNCNCVTLSLKLAGDRRPKLTWTWSNKRVRYVP